MSEQNKTQYNKVEVQKEVEEVVVTEQPEKLTQIVTAKKKKKKLIERLVVGFLDTDGEGTSVGKRVMTEIIVPSAKDMLSNALKNGVDIWMYGSGRNQNNHQQGGYTNYQGQYNGNRTQYNQRFQSQPKVMNQQPMTTGHAIVDFSFNTRADAASVINSLQNQILQYGYASVADYYDLIGEPSAYTHGQYGWYNLSGITPQNHRGGFIIQFPVPEVLR